MWLRTSFSPHLPCCQMVIFQEKTSFLDTNTCDINCWSIVGEQVPINAGDIYIYVWKNMEDNYHEKKWEDNYIQQYES